MQKSGFLPQGPGSRQPGGRQSLPTFVIKGILQRVFSHDAVFNFHIKLYPVLRIRRRFYRGCLRVIDQIKPHSQITIRPAMAFKRYTRDRKIKIIKIVEAAFHAGIRFQLSNAHIFCNQPFQKFIVTAEIYNNPPSRARQNDIIFLSFQLAILPDSNRVSGGQLW